MPEDPAEHVADRTSSRSAAATPRTCSRSGACTGSTRAACVWGAAASSAAGAPARTAGSRTPSPIRSAAAARARRRARPAGRELLPPLRRRARAPADLHAARRRRRAAPGYAADDESRSTSGHGAARGREPRDGARGYRVTAEGEEALEARSCEAGRVLASASGNGKTTLGRELARRLDVPFDELDALVHGPNWTETTATTSCARWSSRSSPSTRG